MGVPRRQLNNRACKLRLTLDWAGQGESEVMRRTGWWVGAVAGAWVLGVGTAGAVDLPPGPNRELVLNTCQACHGLEMIVESNETREVWNTLLDSMTSYGLKVSPEDRAKILDYLATALGPKPAP
jgi:hypothetical protein